MRRPLWMVSLVLMMAALAAAQDGLRRGDVPPSFLVDVVTGRLAGKRLPIEFVFNDKLLGVNPGVMVFCSDPGNEPLDRGVMEMMRMLDETVDRNRGRQMSAALVLLTDPRGLDSARRRLQEAADDARIRNVVFAISEERTVRDRYRIDSRSAQTVLMWRGGRIQVTRSFRPGELNPEAIRQLVGDTYQILK